MNPFNLFAGEAAKLGLADTGKKKGQPKVAVGSNENKTPSPPKNGGTSSIAPPPGFEIQPKKVPSKEPSPEAPPKPRPALQSKVLPPGSRLSFDEAMARMRSDIKKDKASVKMVKPAKPHAFQVFKENLVGIEGRARIDKDVATEVIAGLDVILQVLKKISPEAVYYRCLNLLSILVDTTPTPSTMQRQKAHMCLGETFPESELIFLCRVISKVREAVGTKIFHEQVCAQYEAMIRDPDCMTDPPFAFSTVFQNRKKLEFLKLRDDTPNEIRNTFKKLKKEKQIAFDIDEQYELGFEEKRLNLSTLDGYLSNAVDNIRKKAALPKVSFAKSAESSQQTSSKHSLKTNLFSFADHIPQEEPQPQSSMILRLLKAVATVAEADSTRMESLKSHLISLLLSEATDDALQSDLLDCLGYDHVEVVGEVLGNRARVVDELLNAPEIVVEAGTSGHSNGQEVRSLVTDDGPMLANFTVESKTQSRIRKDQRKEQLRAKKETSKVVAGLGEVDKLEYLLAVRDQERKRQRELQEAQWNSNDGPAPTRKRYPYVFDSFETGALKPIAVDSAKMALPEGSTFKRNRRFEEIYVPPTPQGAALDFQKVKVSTLDPLGKLGFEGFKELNTIQSIVFDKAYHTVENLLICAPTGAGKTNIAMLTVLKTIRDHCKPDGTIDKNDFKIIYIAPMKALAAEMTASFSKRLAKLGLKVRELTGDTTLTKKEISETQMLVLTPEKWDVVTRKADDDELTSLVRLLIIDEVHLLHDERGPVIETIVARTRRRVQMSQHRVRIVGLSATLPNYVDVATFLGVDPEKGLFFFDGRFRPIPLAQTFIGCATVSNRQANAKLLDDVCYEKCLDFVQKGHQVLVFVHTRNGTLKIAKHMLEAAGQSREMESFLPPNTTTKAYLLAKKQVSNARNRELEQLFLGGFGIHHAGMTRPHRSLVERLFAEGHIRVLACTATLAWGVNLPAHAVIIRGTEVFDQQKGAFSDLGVLDVQQIFGRAGRPQFESSGHGIIITSHDKILKYVTMLIRQAPIESQFMQRIHDNLNAEIAAGTVSNLDEAVEWLRYTYMYVRARLNPMAYGMNYSEMRGDPTLTSFLNDLCFHAAKRLDQNRMIVFDSINGFLSSTDLGRIASHFYVTYETIETVNAQDMKVKLTADATEDHVLAVVCRASEFKQIKARDTEMADLDELSAIGCVMPNRNGTLATTDGKVNCLLQSYISQSFVTNFALTSEMLYIAQNASRIARAFFEIVLRRGWASTTHTCLLLSKCIQQRLWSYQTPLRQLGDHLKASTVNKIEGNRLSFGQLFDLSASELGSLFSCDGHRVYAALRLIPFMDADATIKPVTGSIVQIESTVTPAFTWNDSFHGQGSARFWVFIEDLDDNILLHYEPLTVPKKKVIKCESQRLVFTIPVRDAQMRHQFQLRIASDSWVSEDTMVPISLQHYAMPEEIRPHTDLLPLDPLPITALKNSSYQSLYSFGFFNPVQTQVFHCLYHTDQNSLIGAPTSSGKTLCAELAIYRVLNKKQGRKCVYIAPLKALVRERVLDWNEKFTKKLGIKIAEVSGDHTPDAAELNAAAVLITTPEKWDGITRSWATRDYVRQVDLVVVDEIHLLGVERGAVLEAIITRLKLIARKRASEHSPVRVVGLSTALANAADIAQWLDVKDAGLYNFRPSVRPVPIEVHIQGFPGQHYCPRMALMNKPAFKAIKQFSPFKPTLIFVASRRQTRITAMAFVTMLAAEDDPRQWLHMDMAELEAEFTQIHDENLRLTLPFGIGMHHAGLQPTERAVVERLFVERKIQVLIATSTLAWGINCPAHLVIVKGTEYFDGAQHKYVDFPVTDVLQMIGRAGRPQYDDSAVAVVYVQDTKKLFYKRFLYEPFPVESSLLGALPNHANAEICAGSVSTKQQVVEYLSGTYLYRRLFANPGYYSVEDTTPEGMTAFISTLVDDTLGALVDSFCIDIEPATAEIFPTVYGKIASNYYLEHITVRHFVNELRAGLSVAELLTILADCPEYAVIPVRHNEEFIQEQLNRVLPHSLPKGVEFESPHVKVNLLYQAHFSQFEGLSADYVTDLRSIVDACIRILQAMFDVLVAKGGCLDSVIGVVILLQQVIQGRWYWDHPLLCLPAVRDHTIDGIGAGLTIPQLQEKYGIDKRSKKFTGAESSKLARELMSCTILEEREARQVVEALCKWPILNVENANIQIPGGKTATVALQINPNPKTAITLAPNTRYKLRLRIKMLGPNANSTEAYSPRFHKEKTASWIMLVASKSSNNVLGFSKVAPIEGSRDVRVTFTTPQMPGPTTLTVFILSDAYLGIDQEYDVPCVLR
uniref:MIF4G domain-containing protein n=1 Tax=Panagrellus redivivus TaxID=6233 RepID=A0A7E4USK6_PANRE